MRLRVPKLMALDRPFFTHGHLSLLMCYLFHISEGFVPGLPSTLYHRAIFAHVGFVMN